MSATALFAGSMSPRPEDYAVLLIVVVAAFAGAVVVWFGYRTAPTDRRVD